MVVITRLIIGSQTKKAPVRAHILYWCRRWDLNPHGVTRLILSQVRLPFRHSGTSEQLLLYRNDYTLSTIFFTISISSSFCCFQVNATTVITPCSMRSTSVGISSLSNSK